jgi:hypothetical protein
MEPLAEPPRTPQRPRWTPWAVAALATAALVFVLGLHPPQPGEGPLLRWLRMLAEHPVRAALAMGLVLWATSRPVKPSADDPGHGPRQGL